MIDSLYSFSQKHSTIAFEGLTIKRISKPTWRIKEFTNTFRFIGRRCASFFRCSERFFFKNFRQFRLLNIIHPHGFHCGHIRLARIPFRASHAEREHKGHRQNQFRIHGNSLFFSIDVSCPKTTKKRIGGQNNQAKVEDFAQIVYHRQIKIYRKIFPYHNLNKKKITRLQSNRK